MADNTILNPGTAGDVIATDDIAGVKHQRVKLEFGADGSATDVSSATPLPVTDDSVHAVNAALSKATAIAGQLDDVATTAATENNVAPARITAQRALHVSLRDDGGNVVGDIATPVYVTADGLSPLPVAPATGAIFNVQGERFHDDPDETGLPIKIGYRAIAHGANPTAVAAADRTQAYANRAGIPFVIGGHPNIVTQRSNFTSAQGDVGFVVVGAGTKIVVTGICVTASNANTVNVSVFIGFGTIATPTTLGVFAAHPGIPPGGGFVRGDGSGIIGIGADNQDCRITCSVPTGGSIDVVITYYTIES